MLNVNFIIDNNKYMIKNKGLNHENKYKITRIHSRFFFELEDQNAEIPNKKIFKEWKTRTNAEGKNKS